MKDKTKKLQESMHTVLQRGGRVPVVGVDVALPLDEPPEGALRDLGRLHARADERREAPEIRIDLPLLRRGQSRPLLEFIL